MYSTIKEIGIKKAINLSEVKKIKLLNTYALIWIHFSLIFIILNLIAKPAMTNIYLLSHSLSILILTGVLFCNQRGVFNTAKILFISTAYIVILLLSIFFKSSSYTVIYLTFIPLVVLSLYEKITVPIIALIVCLVTYNWVDFFLDENLSTTKAIQHLILLKEPIVTSLFFASFFLVLHFKKNNIKNEQLLEKQRDKLLTDKIILEKQEIKLRELNEFKSHFFVNLSHEIRTPITLIKGYTSRINLDDTKTSNTEKLTIVNAQVHQIENIINNILDLSKLDNNKLSINRSLIEFTPFLNKHYTNFNELFIKKNILFKLTSNVSNLLVDMDYDLISKSFNNLLTNALKFTPENGTVHIIVEYTNALEISFIDNGIGVPEEDIDAIFERFYQSKNDITKSQGSGIGLSFTKDILEAHNFFITVHSNPNVKTIFKVTIPEKFITSNTTTVRENIILENNIIKKTEKAIISTKMTTSKGATILIVDDNFHMRNYLKEILFDYTILEAENGKEALKTLQNQKIDLLLTDYMMPVMDGKELIKQVKKHNFKIPIIVLTARIDDIAKLNMLRIGIDGYLIKPFIEEELLLFVKNSLRFHRISKETERKLTVIERNHFKTFSSNFEEQILQLINNNIANVNFGVIDVANHFNISQRTLNRKVKSILGHTTRELITRSKIEKAREIQLKKPYLSQKEIASKVAITNTSYLFKKLEENYGKHYIYQK